MTIKSKQMQMLIMCLLAFVWVMAFPMTAGAADASPVGTPEVQTENPEQPIASDEPSSPQPSATEEPIVSEQPEQTPQNSEMPASENTPEALEAPMPSMAYQVTIPGNIEFGNLLSYEKDQDVEIPFEIAVDSVSEGCALNIKIQSSDGQQFGLYDAAGHYDCIPLHLYAEEKECGIDNFLCENYTGGKISCKIIIKAEDLAAYRIYQNDEENTKAEFLASVCFSIQCVEISA